MRTTDDLNPPPPWKGLGERVTKPASAPASSSPTPPRGPYGLVTGDDGRIRTTRDNLPKIVEDMLPHADNFDAWGMLL